MCDCVNAWHSQWHFISFVDLKHLNAWVISNSSVVNLEFREEKNEKWKRHRTGHTNLILKKKSLNGNSYRSFHWYFLFFFFLFSQSPLIFVKICVCWREETHSQYFQNVIHTRTWTETDRMSNSVIYLHWFSSFFSLFRFQCGCTQRNDNFMLSLCASNNRAYLKTLFNWIKCPNNIAMSLLWRFHEKSIRHVFTSLSIRVHEIQSKV